MNMMSPMRITEQIGPVEMPNPSLERNSTAAWLAGLLLFIYPLGSLFPFIYKNIAVGDLALGCAYLFGFLRFFREYIRFLATGYWVIACLVPLGMGTSILVMGQNIRALDALAQVSVILWLLLPLVAIGLAEMQRPLRLLIAGAWVYFTVAVAGAGMLFLGGSELLIRNSGSNRYFIVIPLVPFEACLVPLALAGLFVMRKLLSWESVGYLLLLSAAVLAAVLADSRTSIVVAVASVLTALAINRRPIVALAVGSILSSGYLLFRRSDWLNDMFGLGQRSLLDDRGRTDLMVSAYESLGTDMQEFVFGAGWQGSGFVTTEQAIVLHNTYLQIMMEWGLLGLLGWLGIWILPWTWLMHNRRGDPMEWQVALLTIFSVQLAWMFHPIATTRLHWLGFAVGLGMAYRVYLRGQNRAGAPVFDARQRMPRRHRPTASS